MHIPTEIQMTSIIGGGLFFLVARYLFRVLRNRQGWRVDCAALIGKESRPLKSVGSFLPGSVVWPKFKLLPWLDPHNDVRQGGNL